MPMNKRKAPETLGDDHGLTLNTTESDPAVALTRYFTTHRPPVLRERGSMLPARSVGLASTYAAVAIEQRRETSFAMNAASSPTPPISDDVMRYWNRRPTK